MRILDTGRDLLKKLLERLADRIGMYAGRETVFPHEIGVFLDYPLADVEGFYPK